MTYYLAIDLGASSGRLMLGHIQQDRLMVEEIHRFPNQMETVDGHATWNTQHLVSEIKIGLKKCKEIQKIPSTIGLDTWGVDYVLLDCEEKPILPVYAYRDARTTPILPQVERLISPERLYEITGCQKQPFNTIYQLYVDQQQGRLNQARSFLMIPEYLAFCLTGQKVKEYTNATTTGLIEATTGTWSDGIISKLGLNPHLFDLPLEQPGSDVGMLSAEVADEVGFQAKVVLVGTHDTASAVIACPLNEKTLFISSGTWSLMGVELSSPLTTPSCQRGNFTNEGGYPQKIRFLKNIMGLWMIQNLRKEMSLEENREVTFPELIRLARASKYTQTFDVNDERFLNPPSMRKAIESLLLDALPLSWGDVVKSVYLSLAVSYMQTVKEIEALTGNVYDAIHVIGGGSQDTYLNELTQKCTQKRVFYGPCEATAIGNLLIQWMSQQKNTNIDEARKLVQRSFDIKEISHAQSNT